jgi:putative DNA primase/helicase
VMTLYMKEQKATDKKLVPVKPENIPNELKVRPQWIAWQAEGEKPDKVPYSARTGHRASTTDLMTWSTFEEAFRAYESDGYDGVGFVFSSGDPYVGVDLDDCVDPGTGEVALWALQTSEGLDSYTELSPSGKGLHIIVRGKVPRPLKRDQIEMYCMERFFTMTGHIVGAERD